MKRILLLATVLTATSTVQAAINPTVKQFLTARVQYGLTVDKCKSKADLSNLKSSRSFAIAYANKIITERSEFIQTLSIKQNANSDKLSLEDAANLSYSTATLQGGAVLIDYVLQRPNFKTTDVGYDEYFALLAAEQNNVLNEPSLCADYEKQFIELSHYASKNLNMN